MRYSLGRGTSAARRYVNSSGLITMCVVRSRQAVLRLSATALLISTRPLGIAGRVM